MSHLPATLNLDKALLRARARAHFDFWCGIIEPLIALPVRGILRTIRDLSIPGVAWKTIYKKYLAVRKRGLIALVDRKLAGPGWWITKGLVRLAPEDIELVRLYAAKNRQSTRAAMKLLCGDWRKGIVKTRTPLHGTTRMPRGWSIRNLSSYAPTKFELKSVRIGHNAAKGERPTVFTTRKGLWKMGRVMIDDMWHNLMANTFAENQGGRVLELFSHDLYSARKVCWGVRVRTKKWDGRYNQLTEQMTRMVIAQTLYLQGYSPRGTIFTGIEHGTAAIPPWLERVLRGIAQFPDGKPMITVDRAGMTGARAHIGQYSGLVRGNCNAKASLESSNHLVQNTFAHLPAQVGNCVENRPEEMHGSGPVYRREKDADGTLRRVMVREGGLLWHNQCLLAARRYLSPANAAKLQFPLLEIGEFMEIADELYQGIEQDEEHDCNDWEECRFFRNQLLIGGHWVDQDEVTRAPAFSEEHGQLLAQMIESGAVKTRLRRMSRRRVWDGGGELIRIGGHDVVAILGDDLAVPRTIAGNLFSFQDAEVGPGTHRFSTLCQTPHGQPVRLQDRKTFSTFINPFDPDTMFVRDMDGSYIGECKRDNAPCSEDVDAGERKMGEVAKTVAELLIPIRKTMMKDDLKARQQKNNEEVLGGDAKRVQRDFTGLADAALAAAGERFDPADVDGI